MNRILLTETAFHRVQPRLGGPASGLECLTMDKDGIVRLGGREISADDARPDCGWLSHDLFVDAVAARYLGVLMQSPALSWVQSAGAGLDHPVFAMLAQKGVRLTTNHSQALGMAEYVLWGVLDHFQGGKAHAAEQAAQRWTKRRSREISGSRWLIVGFGAIGEAVARRAKAFDAHVTGIRRRPGQSAFADAMATPERLRDHLGDSDVVVLSVPQTAQTANLVDAEFLAAMKPGSVLVNVGRGGLIDEEALLAALDAGKPEHALLDVFRTEPLPADSRFWNHPRVTLTAHTSALSAGAEARAEDLFLDNLGRYIAGQPLLNEVTAAEMTAAAR
ncbi:MAG TPA: D-2-hydroxyacid dehydrogenase [Rhizomicrobium sp.]